MNRFTFLLAAFLVLAVPPHYAAAACTANDFGEVVDETAQALRNLNASGGQRFQAKLKEYQAKHNLSDKEVRSRAAKVQDQKMGEFNREIENLVSRMDNLSQTPSNEITCEKLEELKQVRDRLLTVMGQKSGYMLARADLELDKPSGGPSDEGAAKPKTASTEAPSPSQETAPGKQAKADIKPKRPATQAPEPPRNSYKPDNGGKPQEQETLSSPQQAVQKPPLDPDLPERRPPEGDRVAGNWQTDSRIITPPPAEERQTAYVEPEAQQGAPLQLTPPAEGEPLPDITPADEPYSIAEIQEAGRGLFGPVSAQFAAAVNYAFQRFGQPTAYIAGSEGGGAILAGLRYGKGMLHTKTEPPRVIYWQGPSLGYDLGAEGSDTLFLVYNLEQQDEIYGRFKGIGGSAYVAGGVGLNVLGKDGMVMVPIRTGIGLRIGANLAYLKFTERQTWNPF